MFWPVPWWLMEFQVAGSLGSFPGERLRLDEPVLLRGAMSEAMGREESAVFFHQGPTEWSGA